MLLVKNGGTRLSRGRKMHLIVDWPTLICRVVMQCWTYG